LKNPRRHLSCGIVKGRNVEIWKRCFPTLRRRTLQGIRYFNYAGTFTLPERASMSSENAAFFAARRPTKLWPEGRLGMGPTEAVLITGLRANDQSLGARDTAALYRNGVRPRTGATILRALTSEPRSDTRTRKAKNALTKGQGFIHYREGARPQQMKNGNAQNRM
jgi:hypothetical protein